MPSGEPIPVGGSRVLGFAYALAPHGVQCQGVWAGPWSGTCVFVVVVVVVVSLSMPRTHTRAECKNETERRGRQEDRKHGG